MNKIIVSDKSLKNLDKKIDDLKLEVELLKETFHGLNIQEDEIKDPSLLCIKEIRREINHLKSESTLPDIEEDVYSAISAEDALISEYDNSVALGNITNKNEYLSEVAKELEELVQTATIVNEDAAAFVDSTTTEDKYREMSNKYTIYGEAFKELKDELEWVLQDMTAHQSISPEQIKEFLELLVNAVLDRPEDPWVENDDIVDALDIEFLQRCGLIISHPQSVNRFKLIDLRF